MDPRLAEELHTHLHEYGLELNSERALGDLTANSSMPASLQLRHNKQSFQLFNAPQMTASAIQSLTDTPGEHEELLIVGPRITERSAEMFRRSGVHYLDGSGNTHIAFGDVIIDVRGRRPVPDLDRNARVHSRGGVNLLSPKRAQLIFAILSWEHLLQEPVRTLAAASHVSIGQAQNTLELLQAQGFLSGDRSFPPLMREQLLEQWVHAYPSGLGAAQLRMELTGDVSLPVESDIPLVVSGESAVGRKIRPESLTIYSTHAPNALIRERKWRRAEGRPSIFLKRQFWDDPYQEHEDGTRSAPPLLIYADLLSTQDSRQREVASSFREQHDQLRAG